jgi:DNA-binding protein HU-beta
LEDWHKVCLVKVSAVLLHASTRKTFMFHLFTPSKYWAILALIVLGIESHGQAMAAPPEPIQIGKPELINLYFAERNRSHCDHLVVAILQGTIPSTKSTEGHVINLFPPGNTGTKNLPKEGQVVSMFPPGNDGTRTDTGVGQEGELSRMNKAELVDAIAGDANLSKADAKKALESLTTNEKTAFKKGDRVALIGFGSFSRSARTGRNPQTGAVSTLEDLKQGQGVGSGDSKPGAVNYSDSRSNRPSSTNAGGGDAASKSDVVQCEHCGASCTEPCRCNPSGIGLIFGATDDQLGMMQYEEDFTYITYKTSYGMRAVTLVSMGPGSNQTLAIAKGWRRDNDCHEDHKQGPPVSVDPNPWSEVGVAHNRTLDYLTPDLNLTLLNLRQGNDKVVRKKPGRTTFANITLKRAGQAGPSDELVYLNSCLFMSHIYRIPADQFLLPNALLTDGASIAEDGYRYYQDVQKRISAIAPVRRAFQQLEETIMLSPDLTAFNRSVDRQVIETLQSRELNDEERSLVLGSLSLAKGTVAYWNSHDDIFDGDIIERGNGKFWADLAGFAAGFTGALVYNNNNGGASDVNPFTTGTAAGSFASSLVADKDVETGN